MENLIVKLICLALVALIIMLLWNALIPVLLGLHSITYWQAMGLRILVRGLFGQEKINRQVEE